MLLLLLAIAFFSQTDSLSCTEQYQCRSVATDYNYVNCVSGTCQCSSLGFSGNATISNPCQCPSPNSVYWAGSPYCIQYSDAVAYKIQQAKNDYQIAVVKSVYQSLIWPTPAFIMGALIAGHPSPISVFIAANATGRVDPLGKFSTQDGIVEYFYGSVYTGTSRISNVTFVKVISQNNIVSIRNILHFDIYDNLQENIIFSYNLLQSGPITFNSNGLIQFVDLIIHNLGANSDAMTPAYSPAVIGQLCYLIMNVASCNSTYDPLGYYTDMNDCLNHFTNVYQWGSWDNIYFNGNTTTCRYFHTLLAIARPAVHCSHSGKTGGGVCVPHTYANYFNEFF